MLKRVATVTLALLCCAAAALAQGALTATLMGTVIRGSFTTEAPLARGSAAVCSLCDTTLYLLADAARLDPLAAGETGSFSVDLATADGEVLMTDTVAQTTQTLPGLTQAQREQFLAGQLSVRVYQGANTSENLPLAELSLTAPAAAMTVSSAGIRNGVLGNEYGRKGTQKNKGIPTLSPPLTVQNLPQGTAALAVTVIDPDGGDWVHWLATNLPAVGEVPQNASIDWAEQMVQGKNDFGQRGYGGPTPPSGTHTYVITVYALSEPLALKAGFRVWKLDEALEGKVLGQASLTGDYSR